MNYRTSTEAIIGSRDASATIGKNIPRSTKQRRTDRVQPSSVARDVMHVVTDFCGHLNRATILLYASDLASDAYVFASRSFGSRQHSADGGECRRAHYTAVRNPAVKKWMSRCDSRRGPHLVTEAGSIAESH